MRILPLSEDECLQILADAGFGRLGCARGGQPYVVPIYFVVGDGAIYSFALPGQKVQWMRENPRVCIETDSVVDGRNWTSVVVLGRYTELADSQQYQQERGRAHTLLQARAMWWEPGAVPPEGASEDRSHVPVFYRISIDHITGYRAEARSRDEAPAR